VAVEVVHTLNGPPGAPVVVLSNSLGTTWEMWAPQLPALSTGFQVLRYNARGHGGSPAPPGPYAIADLGGDLLELLDRLEIERASICGVSIGGMTGMWVGVHAPERVERLVLCATSASMAPPEPWRERAALVRAKGVEPVIDATIDRWFTPEFVQQGPPVVARTRALLASTDREAYASCCEAIAAMDQREDVAAIEAPTLVISASDDPSAPPDHGRLLAERIPDARFELLEQARHLVSLEKPDLVTPLILEHLEPLQEAR
jgi:3-oxoadipate enol-lactonase